MSRVRLRPADEGGYSLVEMTAVLMILGTIVGAVTTLFVSGSKAQVQMSERFQAQSTARTAMDRLRRDVHCATSATVAGSTATLSYTQSTCLGQTQVSWCTASVGGSATRFTLHRQTGGSACSSSSQPYADYLVGSSIFTYEPASIANLAKLKANLQIKTDQMQSPLTLCDVLVLRNSAREGSDSDPAIQCS